MESMKFMKLGDLVTLLDSLNEMSYIYIQKGTRSAEAEVAVFPIEAMEEQGVKPPSDMEYFLEIETAKDVLKAWSFMRGGRLPTTDEKLSAIIYYAENDAYQPV